MSYELTTIIVMASLAFIEFRHSRPAIGFPLNQLVACGVYTNIVVCNTFGSYNHCRTWCADLCTAPCIKIHRIDLYHRYSLRCYDVAGIDPILLFGIDQEQGEAEPLSLDSLGLY